MAYLKLVGHSVGIDTGRKSPLLDEDGDKVAYVRTSAILELCDRRGWTRLYETIEEAEYNQHQAAAPDDYRKVADDLFYKYFPTVEVTIALDRGEDDVHMIVLGTAAEIVAQIEALENPDETPDATGHVINERGVWQSGEQYEFLDHATDPDNGHGYLCRAPNKSTSSGALANTDYWCRFDLPAAT